MSRIFLLRHAQSVANEKGILSGRLPGIDLSAEGKRQRDLLTERLAGSKFDLVLSSPMDRCQQTLEIFLQTNQHSMLIDHGLTEVDYGIWTGKSFKSLKRNSDWQQIIKSGSKIRFKDGESVKEVQKRAMTTLNSYIKKRNKNILVSTHADVVKFALFHALGVSLDNLEKMSIDNASISVIDFEKESLRVRLVNDRSAKIRDYLK